MQSFVKNQPLAIAWVSNHHRTTTVVPCTIDTYDMEFAALTQLFALASAAAAAA